MAFAGIRVLAAIAVFFAASSLGGTLAQPRDGTAQETASAVYAYSPLTTAQLPVWRAGLWDKPNQACIDKCEVFVNKSCFTELSKKNPTADPASIQFQCEDKFSMCLYDCMCDTCDENQIIIKEP